MKTIILAAGYATRLYPLTENFPKPLLPVGDKAILDWLVEDIQEDTEEIILVSNHKFAHIFSEWAKDKEKLQVYDDGTGTNETRLGAVKDILLAVRKAHIHEDVLVMAGDNMLDFSLKGFIRYARSSGASCVMCHEENDLSRLRKTAVISMDQDGLITSYEEKPRDPKGHFAVPPFYYYKKEHLPFLETAMDEGCNPDAPGSFAAWLSHRVPMKAYLMPGKRYDIGDRESYEQVKQLWLHRTCQAQN
ncbi:MAG: nucleotidyltransferase family protein [Blautia sp.]|nr:nucleotidyltransferase family protein [Blautia sp.]